MDPDQVTDATNSDPATPTGEAVVTDTTTSTTDQTPTPDADQPKGDDDTGTAPNDGGGDALDESASDLSAKPDGEGEDDKDKPDADALTGAPEGDYSIPEELDLDPEGVAEFTPLAKELNLSDKGFAKLAEAGVPLVEKAINKAMVNSVVAQRKAWESDGRAFVQGGKLADGTEIAASPVFAGQNHDAVMAVSAKAVDRFASDEAGQPLLFPNSKVNIETGELEPGTFRDFLKTTGLGNHPAMLFAFYKVGSAISEDSDFERHGATPTTKLTREEKYYPHKQT